jgi:hypothetical protein
VRIAGRTLEPTVLRIALLLLALPVLVAAVDAMARLRRARVPLVPGLRGLAWRVLPPFAALIIAYALVLLGLLPGPSGGVPPLPGDVPFDATAGLALVVSIAGGAAVWAWTRRRVRRIGADTPVEATAALVAMAVLLVVTWLLKPEALVLALPAAHAGLVATVVPRRWQVLALAGVAVLPLIGLCVVIGDLLDRNPLFAAWYLLETTATGARGALGPILAVPLATCVWALGALVAFRARKGLVVASGPAPTDRPPRRSVRRR